MSVNNSRHAFPLLFLGISASLWAVVSRQWTMPLIWLAVLVVVEIVSSPRELTRVVKRLGLLALTLGGVSFLQILFRRSGPVIWAVKGFPLIFEAGLREAGLLWIRFMILLVLARLLARLQVFEVWVLLSRWRVSPSLSLLLGMTFKLIPFLYQEARSGVWQFHFRGVVFRSLPFREKGVALKQWAYGVLMRGVEYTHHSAAALELRGYGHPRRRGIDVRCPWGAADWVLSGITLIINGLGFIYFN